MTTQFEVSSAGPVLAGIAGVALIGIRVAITWRNQGGAPGATSIASYLFLRKSRNQPPPQ